MGRLLILKKDPGIARDFQSSQLFTSFACASLHEDEQHYYVTLIPQADKSPAYETLIQRWQPHVEAVITPAHGSSRQPRPDDTYKYVLAHYPIIHLAEVQHFYKKHHSAKLDELMLDYCRRYIDFDFIYSERESLLVFAKDIDSSEPLPPIEKFPGADQYPEFLADLKELVTTHLKAPSKLTLLAKLDNQQLAKQFSPGLFHRKPDATSTDTATTYSSFKL